MEGVLKRNLNFFFLIGKRNLNFASGCSVCLDEEEFIVHLAIYFQWVSLLWHSCVFLMG